MKITVTQKHIDGSTAGWCDGGNCPTATAIKEALMGKYPDLHVSMYDFRVNKWDSDGVRIPLPVEATEQITRFDKELPVKPYEFEFPALDGLL